MKKNSFQAIFNYFVHIFIADKRNEQLSMYALYNSIEMLGCIKFHETLTILKYSSRWWIRMYN